jgi:hypothetical protein
VKEPKECIEGDCGHLRGYLSVPQLVIYLHKPITLSYSLILLSVINFSSLLKIVVHGANVIYK